MKFILLFVSLTLSFLTLAQQHNLWHFGQNTGLDFSSGSPVSISSSIETSESCYTATDNNGNLLFYTNGIKVWDANDNLMPNGTGLNGNQSSQCMVVPQPNTPNKYYIISNEATSTQSGVSIFYSEIDMTLNGGLGDVVASTKNTLLTNNSGEWISAVPHGNCDNIWILTHGDMSNPLLHAFELSNNGISTTPVSTDIGVVFSNFDQPKGVIKPRPNSNQVAFTKPLFSGTIILFDFDNLTGLASNANTIHNDNSTRGFGIEFSRNGDVMYVGNLGVGRIHQYDLTAANIAATRTEIGNIGNSGEVGFLQIAPDDKIYVNYNIFPSGSNFLGVINSPATVGLGCNYVQNALNLGAVTTIYGLPWYFNQNNIPNTALNLGNDTIICSGGSIELNGDIAINSAENYLWSNGLTDSVITVNTAGTYWLDRQIGNCPNESDTIVVLDDDFSMPTDLIDTIVCGPFFLDLNLDTIQNLSDATWQFSNGNTINSTQIQQLISGHGIHQVELNATSTSLCTYTSTNIATIEILPALDFEIHHTPENPAFGDLLVFDINTEQQNFDYSWSINGNEYGENENPSYAITGSDALNVSLSVTDENGCSYQRSTIINFDVTQMIFVPNAFTPDGNENNDVFKIYDINNTVESISIFNRWGELLWKSESSFNYWDGTYDGKLVPDGIYTWKIKYKLNTGEAKIITGFVNVLR